MPRGDQPLTTEQALRRLRILGFTAEDAPIAKALDSLRATLRGEKEMPDRREVTHDWGLFTKLMMSAWLRLFCPDDADACQWADAWAAVIKASFASGAYAQADYFQAYAQTFGIKPCGDRFIDFANFYVVALVANRLDACTEAAFFDYILGHPKGIYYVYHKPLLTPPGAFMSLETSRYLAAMELLARFESPASRETLRFVALWLQANRQGEGWDLGPKARDGVYLPLSDDWRRPQTRREDCTRRIQALLERLV